MTFDEFKADPTQKTYEDEFIIATRCEDGTSITIVGKPGVDLTPYYTENK